jgi:dolichol-phosphate mannosyltransferase
MRNQYIPQRDRFKGPLLDCLPINCFYSRQMISAVIPVCNEQDNVTPLLKEISQAATQAPVTEIIYVDDGSSDNTHAILTSLRSSEPKLRVLRHEHRSGQSAALWTGIKAASNEIIVTLDGDGQNNPADIEKLYKLFEQNGGKAAALMVAGEREKRHDNLIRRISSRSANKIRGWLLKDKTKDTGCSLKMFRRSDYLNLPFFNHMHRFLPALMMRDGVKIEHVNVSHRPRTGGTSKYGTLDRLMASILDLAGMMWLLRRAKVRGKVYEDL